MDEAQNPAEAEYANRLSEALCALEATLDDALAQLAAGDMDGAAARLEAPVAALGAAVRAARDA
jgi:hypothetical protein